MITIKAYQDYFQKFVSSGVVGTLYCIDLLDMDNARADIAKLHPPVLVLEDFTVITTGKDADHLVDRFIGALAILGKSSVRSATITHPR